MADSVKNGAGFSWLGKYFSRRIVHVASNALVVAFIPAAEHNLFVDVLLVFIQMAHSLSFNSSLLKLPSTEMEIALLASRPIFSWWKLAESPFIVYPSLLNDGSFQGRKQHIDSNPVR